MEGFIPDPDPATNFPSSGSNPFLEIIKKSLNSIKNKNLPTLSSIFYFILQSYSTELTLFFSGPTIEVKFLFICSFILLNSDRIRIQTKVPDPCGSGSATLVITYYSVNPPPVQPHQSWPRSMSHGILTLNCGTSSLSLLLLYRNVNLSPVP